VVYRVYPDGKPDELVRGVDIVGTPLSSFARILATSDKPEVFNGYCGAESGSVPVSAVSPAILVSELEIQKKEKGNDRPPLLSPPVLTGGAE
jgi:predicted Zn-dependent protease